MPKLMNWLLGLGLVATALAIPGLASAGQHADTVFVNGHIYTVNQNEPWVEAVAVTDGHYVKTGTTKDVEKLVGPDTKIVDLKGHMAMPGLNDGHVHPFWGAMAVLYACNFPFTAKPDDIARAIGECAAKNPDEKWIRGGQWDSSFFKTYDVPSPRKLLDAVSGDKAVILTDDSGHNSWVNTRALELAGWTKDTPDPKGGTIVRDKKTGEPNGVLLENAAIEMEKIVPDHSHAEYVKGVRKALQIANSFGLTGMKNANAKPPALSAAKEVDAAGDFTVHMAACLSTPYGDRDKPLDYDKLDRERKKFASPHINTNFVKIFLDGVPTVARSAAMLAPYEPDPHFPKDDRGHLHIPLNILAHDVTELDRRGYTVKMHAAGDRSVREGLDAVEATRKTNGNSGFRHELAHAGLVSAADIPRFAKLNVVADLSPYIYNPSPIMNSVIAAIGDRGRHYWPIKTMLSDNTPVLAGSDWPAAVPSINPWIGMEAMVTRKDPYGKTPGALWPEQAITLKQAIHIFTEDGARALRMGDTTGSVEVGKSADLIILNHNLFEVPADQIGDTKILSTWFEGKKVYSADSTQ